MMGRALLGVGWASTLLFAATGAVGYAVADSPRALQLHLLVGLVAALLMLFSHCWILFYLIGTGKAIKEAVAGRRFAAGIVQSTRELKNRSYPPLLLATLLVMATFIVGGGVFVGVLPAWVHQGLFFAALAAQAWALAREGRVLGDNDRLIASLEGGLADPADGTA